MSLPESHYDAPPPAAPYNTPPTLIAFTLVILVLCFVCFSIVYICRYCFVSVVHTWAIHRTASGTIVRLSPNASPYRGLDPSMLQIFPTFLYASVKDLRKEKYSLECAICLVEFENESMLRLLTVCYHVFHQECIDLWLRSHKTCPVCRTELDSPTDETPKPQDNYDHVDDGRSSMEETNHEIRIDVKEREEGSDDGNGQKRGDRGHDHSVSMSVISLQHEEEQRFARSHSTGHSVVMIRGDEGNDDKYRLRLPEYVIRGRHNCRRSCASDKEMINVTLTTRPDADADAAAAASCSNCGFVQTVSGCSSSSQNPTEKT